MAEQVLIGGTSWRNKVAEIGGTRLRIKLAKQVGGKSWRSKFAEQVGGTSWRNIVAEQVGGTSWRNKLTEQVGGKRLAERVKEAMGGPCGLLGAGGQVWRAKDMVYRRFGVSSFLNEIRV